MYLYLNKIFKILFSLFVFSVLIFPVSGYASTQGLLLSGYVSQVNGLYCLTDTLTFTKGTSIISYSFGYGGWQLSDDGTIRYRDEIDEFSTPVLNMDEIGDSVGTVTSSTCVDDVVSSSFITPITTTGLISDITEVTGGMFGGVAPYLFIFAGLPLAFWLVKKLLDVIPKDTRLKVLKLKKVSGYKVLKGKNGQDVGWIKDKE